MTVTESGVTLTFDGDGSGTIIGRRGETLDALQYLASMVSNKGDKEYFRITIDSCGYREKRRKTLIELAKKISKSVLRTGRSTTLEPMNPYERRKLRASPPIPPVRSLTGRSSSPAPTPGRAASAGAETTVTAAGEIRKGRESWILPPASRRTTSAPSRRMN